ncbi:MAG TPA: hypothetical protein VLJ86_14325 [Ramlibacter sp.]|nr:hypothetical protein [Ramlibacter sp.]
MSARVSLRINTALDATSSAILLHKLDHAGKTLAIPAGPGSERLWAVAQSAFAPLVTLLRGFSGSIGPGGAAWSGVVRVEHSCSMQSTRLRPIAP